MRLFHLMRWEIVSVVIMLFVFSGCGGDAKPPEKNGGDAHGHDDHDDHDDDDAHDDHASHESGPHGGTILDWGGGVYHLEFVVDHDAQTATVYVLDSSTNKAKPIAAEKLLLSINEPSFQLDLAAVPLDGETGGKSSRFSGKHEQLQHEQEFAGSISGVADGTPYVSDFKAGEHGHDH